MNKREINKEVQKAIVKDQKSHQEAYDSLILGGGADPEYLAKELSKQPSLAKLDSTRTLRYTYVVLLGIVILLRILGIFVLAEEGGMNGAIILMAIIFGILAPAIGIYAALGSKVRLYQTAGIFLALGIFRSFRDGQFDTDPATLLIYLPFVLAMLLSFYIPSKLKTPFKKVPGADENKSVKIIFEDSNSSMPEILDSDV